MYNYKLIHFIFSISVLKQTERNSEGRDKNIYIVHRGYISEVLLKQFLYLFSSLISTSWLCKYFLMLIVYTKT